MNGYKKLFIAYSELDERYTRLLGEKAECEYALVAVKNETEHSLKQSAEIRSLHENIRRLKHDMKNHFMVIASYLNRNETDSAKKYASEMLDKLNNMHSYIDTGNSLLNHIINEKLEFARSKSISVKAEIENLAFAKIESLDFSAIISNMLDNAIEASEKEKNGQIYIKVKKTRGYEAITVKNKLSVSVLESNPELVTLKSDKNIHGMGISQIRTLTDKYGGLCDFFEEDGYFCACVMLPE